MAVRLNTDALAFAKQLIDEGEYAINTQWSTNEPSAAAEEKYLDQNGWEAYEKWFLAIDTSVTDEKARHKLPIGDFRRLHQSGIIAAKQRAAQNNYADIEQAAEELLDLFDRLSMC